MGSFVRRAARAVAGGMAACAATVAMLFATAGAAAADVPADEPAPASQPNCTAADLAQVSSGVAAATSAYLFTHPTSTTTSPA